MENKQAILDKLLQTLKLTRAYSDLSALTLRTDLVDGMEIVIAQFPNGGQRRINVTADSGKAMVEDIMKYL